MSNQYAALTPDILKNVLKIYDQHGGNKTAAAQALGISRSTFQDRLAKAQAAFAASTQVAVETTQPPGIDPRDLKALDLQQQLTDLRAWKKNITRDVLNDERVRHEIIGIKRHIEDITVPQWTLTPHAATKEILGIPTLFASDWHIGEIVNPLEVGGVNAFNLSIAQARVRRMIEKTFLLLDILGADGQTVPGVVYILGGDLCSGDIHEELMASNEVPFLPSAWEAFGMIHWQIRQLADKYGRVYVPCVTGNHGRLTKKIYHKKRNHTNIEWLVYQFLEKAFESDDRVQFCIAPGVDMLYRIYNHRYLLTHGDQLGVKGGDGIIGALGPITRGEKKKRSRNLAINRPFDTILMGHWHQYLSLSTKIVNSCLKGYDEFAMDMGFDPEIPQQALWVTHPKHHITYSMPVHLEDSLANVNVAPISNDAFQVMG